MPSRRSFSFDPATTVDLTRPEAIPPPPSELRAPAAPPPPVAPAEARISGLAGLCMLVLVVAGLGLPLPGGHLAVDAVLVVIGFQLGMAMSRAAKRPRRWVPRFWLRVLAPIVVPTVVAVALATTYWWSFDRLTAVEVNGALASLTMVANVAPLFTDAGFPAADHLWLVAVIVQFALLAPLAVLLTRRENGTRLAIRWIIVLAAAALTTRLTVAATGLDEQAIRSLATSTRIDGLLLGLGLAIAPRSSLARVPVVLAAPAFIGLLAIFALAPDATDLPVVTLGLLAPTVAVGTGVIIATRIAGNPSDALGRTLGNLTLRWLGTRALSIYVWHQLFGMALTDGAEIDLFGAPWPGSSLFTTRLVFALAAGAASYHYLQVPLRTLAADVWRRRVKRLEPPPEPPGRTALTPG
ncbi:MAG: acyltransferase [Actinomycetota bacterium]